MDGHTKLVKKEGYIINFIEPQRSNYASNEFNTSLKITDGALIIVDYNIVLEGSSDNALRQALFEKIKPVLFINKIDIGINEVQDDGEIMYQKFVSIIERQNSEISLYSFDDMEEPLTLDPTRGTVAFGSALYGWAFTLKTFARIYSGKFKIGEDQMMEKLWGDNYFDSKAKKW